MTTKLTNAETAIREALAHLDDAGGLSALADDLGQLSFAVEDVKTDTYEEFSGMDCNPYIDCRLQYHDGCWTFRTGDSSYDQDHRGAWGCSSVVADMSTDDCKDIAADLVDQVLDCLAEMAN